MEEFKTLYGHKQYNWDDGSYTFRNVVESMKGEWRTIIIHCTNGDVTNK